jgi:uncharacterized membrane protein YeaQ/YmgE (transglycosylase-associated protein family)
MENVDFVTLLVQLIGGALGGNIVAAVIRNLNLGIVGNCIAGFIGGGVGGHLLTTMFNLPAAAGAGEIDPMAILGQVGSGAAGGAVLMIVLGILRSVLAK